MTEVEIGFYKDDKLNLQMIFEEYKEILNWINDHPNDNTFVTFDIENGAGEITFRPDDIKYIKY
jgi:hypothetical protein